jgi:hypothetical protein
MGKRPSSFVAQNPVTGKYNWHAKCGANGPGDFVSKNAADVALQRHESSCRKGC